MISEFQASQDYTKKEKSGLEVLNMVSNSHATQYLLSLTTLGN